MLNRSDIKMTDRQRDIIELLVNESLSNKEIGEQLGISEGTVKQHLCRLYNRVGFVNLNGRSRIRLAALFRPVQERQLVRVPLTEKEWTIAAQVAEGLRNKAIAGRLGTTDKVIRNNIRIIYDKTGVWSRLELAAWVEAHHRGSHVDAHGR